METKFEYQVSPELAEAIAIEQFDVLLRKRGLKLRYLPVSLGFLFTLSWFCVSTILDSMFGGPIYFSATNSGLTNYAFTFTGGSLHGPVTFIFGLGFGLLIVFFIQAIIRSAARSAYAKIGPTRVVSWNSEGFTFQSPVYEIKVSWQIIDRIEVGAVGVYGISGRRAFFAIPSHAFPSNTTPKDLIRAWQSGKKQPAISK